MGISRYWRLVSITTSGNGPLELSEARIYENGVLADASAALSSTFAPTSGAFADLRDGTVFGVVSWPYARYSQPGFSLVWDFGAGLGVESPQLRLGSGNDASRFPLDLTMQSSVNGFDWFTYGLPSVSVTYPGDNAQTVLQTTSLDPYWDSVVVAMHMDGSNDSASFTDLKGHVMTAYGAARLSTVQSKFGGASAIFGATTANKVASAVSADLSLGSGDFTIEMYVYMTASNSSGGWIASSGGGTNGFNATDGFHWLLNSGWSPGDGIDFQYWNGTSPAATGVASATLLNTWTHVAVTYGAGVLRLFINGVVRYSATVPMKSPSANPSIALGEIVGRTGASTNAFSGHVDDFRITKGVARYTAAFVPPDYPFFGPAVLIPVAPNPLARIRGIAPALERLLPSAELPATSAQGHLREIPFFDAYNGGVGMIYGTTKEKNMPANTPLRRRVLLIDEASRMTIRETWSDAATGNYEFRGVKQGVKYTVISYDHLHNYRAVIADNQDAT